MVSLASVTEFRKQGIWPNSVQLCPGMFPAFQIIESAGTYIDIMLRDLN